MLRRTIARGTAISILVGATAFISMSTAQAGGGACHGGPVTDARGSTIEIKDYCFTPTVLHIQPGQSVTWVNRDGAAHAVSGSNLAWGSYEELLLDKSITYRFAHDGVFAYFCPLHVGMVGAVVVGSGNGKGAAGTSTIQPATLVVQPQGPPAAGAGSAQVRTERVVVSKAGPWLWSTLGLAVFGLVAAIAAGIAFRRRSSEGAAA
jgi:plastocyanin